MLTQISGITHEIRIRLLSFLVLLITGNLVAAAAGVMMNARWWIVNLAKKGLVGEANSEGGFFEAEIGSHYDVPLELVKRLRRRTTSRLILCLTAGTILAGRKSKSSRQKRMLRVRFGGYTAGVMDLS